MTSPKPEQVRICGPAQGCADPNTNRWYCMRGHALDNGGGDITPAVPGVCPIPKCDKAGANR